jgi:hypothetical protein
VCLKEMILVTEVWPHVMSRAPFEEKLLPSQLAAYIAWCLN